MRGVCWPSRRQHPVGCHTLASGVLYMARKPACSCSWAASVQPRAAAATSGGTSAAGGGGAGSGGAVGVIFRAHFLPGASPATLDALPDAAWHAQRGARCFTLGSWECHCWFIPLFHNYFMSMRLKMATLYR